MAKETCEFCLGSGFVTNLEYDSTVHQFIPAGLIECKHPGQYDE